MELKDVPTIRSKQYTEKLNVAVAPDMKRKLDALKKVQRKDTAELIRMLIGNFLDTIDFEDAV